MKVRIYLGGLLLCLLAALVGIFLRWNHATKTTREETQMGLQSRYHLTTQDGWSNDLQTIVWNDKEQYYDVYFLHSKDGATNPFGPSGQDWYHTTSKDLLTFSKQNSAIPSHGGHETSGWKSAWTGSIIHNEGQIQGVEKGQPVAYLSGLRKDNGKQAVWAIVSEDNGRTFTKPLQSGQPLLTADSEGASQNQVDERDPYVFTWKGSLYMYIAEGDAIGVYRSEDGLAWSPADSENSSKILPDTFFRGRSWEGNAPVECPVIKTMQLPDGTSKQVLFFGAKDASRGETTGTYYTVGSIDEYGLFIAETDVRRLDQGSDYYGANFDGTTDLGQVNTQLKTMGWIGNWNYTSKGVHVDEEARQPFLDTLGSYSLPRTVRLEQDLTLKQTVLSPKGKKTEKQQATVETPILQDESLKNQTEAGKQVLYDVPQQEVAQLYDLTFERQDIEQETTIFLDIYQGGDYVRFQYQMNTGRYQVATRAGELDQGLEGSVASSYYYDGLLGEGKGYQAESGLIQVSSLQLKIWTDKTSVEIQFPNGQMYTLARFSQSDRQDVKIYTSSENPASLELERASF